MNQVKKEKIKGKEVKKTRYYVLPVDEMGQTIVMKDNPPADMTGVVSVDLPAGQYVSFAGHDREYEAYKIAILVARGLSTLEGVGPSEEKDITVEDIKNSLECLEKMNTQKS